jgi:hypothetical protein
MQILLILYNITKLIQNSFPTQHYVLTSHNFLKQTQFDCMLTCSLLAGPIYSLRHHAFLHYFLMI